MHAVSIFAVGGSGRGRADTYGGEECTVPLRSRPETLRLLAHQIGQEWLWGHIYVCRFGWRGYSSNILLTFVRAAITSVSIFIYVILDLYLLFLHVPLKTVDMLNGDLLILVVL